MCETFRLTRGETKRQLPKDNRQLYTYIEYHYNSQWQNLTVQDTLMHTLSVRLYIPMLTIFLVTDQSQTTQGG
jgi:hypothetical protein